MREFAPVVIVDGSSKIPASSGRKAILNSFIMVRKIYFFNAFSMLRSNNS